MREGGEEAGGGTKLKSKLVEWIKCCRCIMRECMYGHTHIAGVRINRVRLLILNVVS